MYLSRSSTDTSEARGLFRCPLLYVTPDVLLLLLIFNLNLNVIFNKMVEHIQSLQTMIRNTASSSLWRGHPNMALGLPPLCVDVARDAPLIRADVAPRPFREAMTSRKLLTSSSVCRTRRKDIQEAGSPSREQSLGNCGLLMSSAVPPAMSHVSCEAAWESVTTFGDSA
jgi:hypothetical protein